jgi:ABC-type bacteriocin/lantibiotic exporter with double-glycine peptidase domain
MGLIWNSSATTSPRADRPLDTRGEAGADGGLGCLTLLLRFHGIAADPAQISHRFGAAPIGIREMLRCAKELKLKGRAITTDWSRLPNLPLPAIAELATAFLILAQVMDERVLVQSPTVRRPELLSDAEFEAKWTGHLVLMARRAQLSDLARRFDVTWFLQAMPPVRRGDRRLLLPAAVRAGDAAVLPGGDRQGAHPSRLHHPRRADHRLPHGLGL